jgi:iron(III) transport system permease protein
MAALPRPLRQTLAGTLTSGAVVMRVLIVLSAAWLAVAIALPMASLAARSVRDAGGQFVGLANYAAYFASPGLLRSLWNSVWVASASTLISVALGFGYAYALTSTRMRGKGVLRAAALLPLFVPSVAQAIALIYLFGNKGLVTTGLFGALPGLDIGLYGPTGIVLGEVAYCFPQAVMILSVALGMSDARLREASAALRATPLRTFLSVTLPGARYGLVSAFAVCFALSITDFGVPKVVGGSFNVLATDIYKQVIGQQNLAMGAAISVVLAAPAALAFVVDRIIQRRQAAALTARAVPWQPKPNPALDRLMFGFCALAALAIIGLVAVAAYASLVDVWPYQLSLSFRHYDFRSVGGGGMQAFVNSLQMALLTAAVGAPAIFLSAYLVEKGRGLPGLRSAIYLISLAPMALPGLVLGLAYIFFFNQPAWRLGGLSIPNPFNPLYGSLAILVLCNIAHFHTTAFFTATTALKQIDGEFEAVSASLGVPFYTTLRRVTLPICLPALLDVAVYLFVNAMVTVSAVIFLYSPDLKLASVAIVNMDDAGDTAAAAAMSTLVILASLGARLAFEALARPARRRSQAWLGRRP